MAQGVTGSFDVAGERGFTLKIKYSQTYDVSTNKSSVRITGVDLKSSSWYGWTYYLDGTIKINGSAAVTLDSATPNNSCTINSANVYTPVSIRSGMTTISVPHNSDGTKSVTISCNVYGFTAGGGGGSGWEANGQSSVRLTTIPRASSFSVGDVTIGSTATITINRASSSFTHTVTMKLGSYSISAQNALTSASLTPPNEWCKAIPNATQATGTVTVDTYSGGAKIGTASKNVVFRVPGNIVPAITNPRISIVTGFNNMCLQGRSKATVQFSANAGIGASIVSYSISGGGYYSASNNYTTGVLNTPGENVFTLSVRDSRGRTAETTTKLTVTVYNKPTVSVPIICRADASGVEKEDGECAKLLANIGFASLNGQNRIEAKASYRIKRTSAWGGEVDITSGVAATLFVNSIKEKNAYEIKIWARDTVGETSEVIRTINSSANYLITARQGAMGLLKYPDPDVSGVQVGGDLYADMVHADNGFSNIYLPEDYNINNAVNSGFYRLSSNHTNRPQDGSCNWGQMIVCRGADTISQIMMPYERSAMYIRSGNPKEVGGVGSWNQWNKAVMSDSISVTDMVADMNNLTTNGWYHKWSGQSVANCPCEYAGIFVSAKDSGHVTQFCFDYMTQEILRRVRSSGKWEPWEYVNPRGTVGVEYRTTERHLGNAVYTKMVNCGALPFNRESIIGHGAAAREVIRISALRGTKGTLPMVYGNISIDIYADNQNIHIYTKNFGSALSDKVTAQIWYIK